MDAVQTLLRPRRCPGCALNARRGPRSPWTVTFQRCSGRRLSPCGRPAQFVTLRGHRSFWPHTVFLNAFFPPHTVFLNAFFPPHTVPPSPERDRQSRIREARQGVTDSCTDDFLLARVKRGGWKGNKMMWSDYFRSADANLTFLPQ